MPPDGPRQEGKHESFDQGPLRFAGDAGPGGAGDAGLCPPSGDCPAAGDLGEISGGDHQGPVPGGTGDGPAGKNGGYRLGVDPETCTVGSILKCAEGSLAPVACLDCGEEPACPRSRQCRTLPMWQELDRRIDAYLESVTLKDLLEQETP